MRIYACNLCMQNYTDFMQNYADGSRRRQGAADWLTPLFRRPLQIVHWTVRGMGIGRLGDWGFESSLFPVALVLGPKYNRVQGTGNYRVQGTTGIKAGAFGNLVSGVHTFSLNRDNTIWTDSTITPTRLVTPEGSADFFSGEF